MCDWLSYTFVKRKIKYDPRGALLAGAMMRKNLENLLTSGNSE